MDIKRLRYFCAIVEQGQISRAAKTLNMSQPPLSQRLKELEDDLGTPLILREGGEWEVTEAGKILYTHSKKMLSQLDGVRERIRDSVDGFSGEICIGISTACLSYVVNILPGLYKTYPQLRFRIKVTDSNFLEKELIDKFLDLAVVLLPLEEKTHEIRLLPRDTFSVLFGHGIALPHSRPVLRLEDIFELPLVLSRRWWGIGGYENFIALMQEKGARPNVILDSQNIQALVRIMECGLPGVLLIPSREVNEQMRKTFTILPLEEKRLDLEPAVIFQKERFLTQAVAAVMDTIVQEAWKGVKTPASKE